jgi:hypothetical protein
MASPTRDMEALSGTQGKSTPRPFGIASPTSSRSIAFSGVLSLDGELNDGGCQDADDVGTDRGCRGAFALGSCTRDAVVRFFRIHVALRWVWSRNAGGDRDLGQPVSRNVRDRRRRAQINEQSAARARTAHSVAHVHHSCASCEHPTECRR